MSNIRHLVSNHLPLQLTPGSSEGTALISGDDLQELCELADKQLPARVVSYQPLMLEAPVEELKALMVQAHTNIHGEGAVPVEDQPTADRDEEEEQLRNVAMHYATQIVTAKLTHGSSIDALEVQDNSVVDQATAILKFLKGA